MVEILGWYNRRNIGDEAFKDAFEEAFSMAGDTSPLTYHPDGTPTDEKVILGGGDVIKSFYLDHFNARQRVFPIGVGLGYESELGLIRPDQVPFAVVRNKVDEGLWRAAGFDAKYCPDITFILKDIPADERIASEKNGKKWCGVLLSDEINPTFEKRENADYMYYEYYKWELAKILDTISEYYDIKFIAFSTLDSIDDRKMNLDVFRRMSKRDAVEFHHDLTSVTEARTLIARCDVVLSMKYHGMLFACSSDVPFINIGETRKTHLFCEEHGLQDLCVPPHSLYHDRLMALLKLAEREDTRGRIVEVSRSCKLLTRSILPDAVRRFKDA